MALERVVDFVIVYPDWFVVMEVDVDFLSQVEKDDLVVVVDLISELPQIELGFDFENHPFLESVAEVEFVC